MNFRNALYSMLTPVVRFSVKRAYPIQEFIEVVKEAYVEETAREMEESGHKVNVTQIAVSTGMHRRDVTRFFEKADEAEEQEPVGVLMKVLGMWENNRKFQDKAGNPRELTRKGAKNEFHKLVKSVSTDISPRSVLLELERLRLVDLTSDTIALKSEAEVHTASDAEGISQVAHDIETIGALCYENLYERRDPPNLHARTEYDNIFVDSIPEVRKWFVDLGTEMHKRARAFLSEHDKDLNPDPKRKGGGKFVFGTFTHTKE